MSSPYKSLAHAFEYALAGLLLFCFWLSAGLFCAPVWAVVCVVGRCIGAFDSWRATGRAFMDMVMIRWWFEAQP
jgi:VanZ family protein